MAYVSQEKKAELAPAIKAILKKYGVKGSIAVRNHSTLVVNIKSGKIDFIGNYNKIAAGNTARQANGYLDVNPYWYHDHFDGKAQKFVGEMFAAMKGPDWFDKSDSQTDYFHCAHYVDMNIGQWNKPYVVTK